MQYTQVLIVGGSLVGLSASVFLSSRDVANVVIEKHKGSSLHPRAMGFTEHTMEYYRAVGLVDDIPQVEPNTLLRRASVRSVFSEWLEETEWTPGAAEPKVPLSPCRGAAIAQDKLEPILRKRARELGSELKLGFEFISFDEQKDGIVAQIKCRDTGEVESICCQYLIAADGASSRIRETLGIKRSGVGYLRTIRSVMFHCPELDPILENGVQQFDIDNGELQAFLTSYQDGRWVLMFKDDKLRSSETLIEAIQQAIGKPFACSILATGEWDMAGLIAEEYQRGRVFLAGDAAHQLPPTRGGYGANTGIDDAYNLAWKLDLVLRGFSSPSLLETYQQERQPIGRLRHNQTFSRPDYQKYLSQPTNVAALFSNAAMELGQVMRSSSIVANIGHLPDALEPDQHAGQPGIRAPHVWVEKGDKTCSTIDLFIEHFTFLVGSESCFEWIPETPLPLNVLVNGLDVVFPKDQPFEQSFGVLQNGVILIRPDGVVAWRSDNRFEQSHDKAHDLLKVLKQSAFLS